MQDSWRITGQPDVIHEKYSSGINRKCRVSSLRISRVIEQDGQLDAAMPKLREVRRVAITWIQVRGGIVRREQDQRVEEFLQRVGFRPRKFCVATLEAWDSPPWRRITSSKVMLRPS